MTTFSRKGFAGATNATQDVVVFKIDEDEELN
jgi:hypothetical protein